MNKLYSIILTLIAGILFLVGGFISLKVKNKEKLNHFSAGLAFVIIIDLLILDLIPELKELLESVTFMKAILTSIGFIVLGFVLLKILDLFIPDHHHEHHDHEKNVMEHNSHIKHIGLLTLISLVLHNLLEGFALFGLALNDYKAGLFMCLSVSLHNIPLGTHIFSSMDIKKNKGWILLLSLSSLLGGVLFLVVGNISNYILAIVTSITIGMLIYIAFLELLPELLHNLKTKYTILGISVGFLILIISFLL